jgi:Tfp pilus assembly PilM family ATPase
VFVTGGTTQLPGLAEELERLTRVPVRIADPLAGVQLSKNGLAERDDLASLAAAIGLGVEG